MAEYTDVRTTVEAKAFLILNENEISTLDALAGYGIDSFLKVFYKEMGTAYLEPHEAGLRSLFDSVVQANRICDEARECREFLRLSKLDRAKKRAAIR